MNNEIYELDSSIESKHWWFIVRRNLLKFYIKKLIFILMLKLLILAVQLDQIFAC